VDLGYIDSLLTKYGSPVEYAAGLSDGTDRVR